MDVTGDPEIQISMSHSGCSQVTIFEIRLLKKFESEGPNNRVNNEHGFHHVHALLGELIEEELEGYLLVEIELVVALGSQVVALSPLVLRSCTEYLKYGVNLIELTRPREDWHAQKELCHHTSYGPDVACWSIVVGPQGALGCAVPSSRHVSSVWWLHITHIS
jgi:hypothetical protein